MYMTHKSENNNVFFLQIIFSVYSMTYGFLHYLISLYHKDEMLYHHGHTTYF